MEQAYDVYRMVAEYEFEEEMTEEETDELMNWMIVIGLDSVSGLWNNIHPVSFIEAVMALMKSEIKEKQAYSPEQAAMARRMWCICVGIKREVKDLMDLEQSSDLEQSGYDGEEDSF